MDILKEVKMQGYIHFILQKINYMMNSISLDSAKDTFIYEGSILFFIDDRLLLLSLFELCPISLPLFRYILLIAGSMGMEDLYWGLAPQTWNSLDMEILCCLLD